MLDVGQGDSFVISSNNETALIDTGGKVQYNNPEFNEKIKSSNNADNIIIPTLKSLGIKKLKYLILTHGDADHLGDALPLIKNFKVEKIIINQGNINYYEKQLIKNHQNVIMSSELNQLKMGHIRMIELNTSYNDENDSSQVYLANYQNINILLTGDASIKTEENILSKYDLPEIDILKVGHHGSKTSSGKNLIEIIKPKYSLISVGIENKFGHPNQEVLNNLKKSKVYRTDHSGSVTIKINNNKLQIETCI